MIENKHSQAIDLAKTFLHKNKRDSLHDLKHVEAVWRNCLALIKEEQLTAQIELLEVAVYWHDVVVDTVKWPSKLMVEDTCNYLAATLPTLDFTELETNTVIEIITHHEFRDTPTLLEGLILQEADKIDATSIERGTRMLEDYQKGLTPKETFISYMRTYLKWISILDATFYFSYSRKVVAENIQEFWSNEKSKEIIAELGLEKEYQTAKASRNSFKTIAIRLFLRAKAAVVKMKINV